MYDDLVARVNDKVQQSIELAEKHFETQFPCGEVLFNLRGRSAGQVRFPIYPKEVKQYSKEAKYFPKESKQPTLRFNRYLLETYQDEFIDEVVPHECAHLVVYHLYLQRRLASKVKPKPHGIEWQSVMRNLYGLVPIVTHQFEVQTQNRKRFVYRCGCEDKEHSLSSIRHNKIQKKHTIYLCKTCRAPLQIAV